MNEWTFSFAAMSCRMELTVLGLSEVSARAAAEAVEAETRRIEQKFSRYRADSVVSAINRAAGGLAVAVDDETAALLDFAATCHGLSDGLFDITSGILRRVWRPRRQCLPTAGEISEALTLVGWQQAVWQRPCFALNHVGMEIDLGGLGKEYAADRAATILRGFGVDHALVNFGGDLHAVGPRLDGAPWRIGIAHPRRSGEILGVLPLSCGGLATSGDYERAFVLDGRRYSHLLDPATGWPVHGLTSVSVSADSCIAAGALASIGMLKGAAGISFLRSSGAPFLAVDENGVPHSGDSVPAA
jgi:thiamine biosynthesis lipoprotein